jgi:hypothetical protein
MGNALYYLLDLQNGTWAREFQTSPNLTEEPTRQFATIDDDDFCDCETDCTEKPEQCACAEAQACCSD